MEGLVFRTGIAIILEIKAGTTPAIVVIAAMAIFSHIDHGVLPQHLNVSSMFRIIPFVLGILDPAHFAIHNLDHHVLPIGIMRSKASRAGILPAIKEPVSNHGGIGPTMLSLIISGDVISRIEVADPAAIPPFSGIPIGLSVLRETFSRTPLLLIKS